MAREVRFDDIAALRELVSAEYGPWGADVEVTQDMIQRFADLTGDQQWIHVDVERARRESPFGGPIAHGFLTLGLLSALRPPLLFQLEGHRNVTNYGAASLRFVSPVPAGVASTPAPASRMCTSARRGPCSRSKPPYTSSAETSRRSSTTGWCSTKEGDGLLLSYISSVLETVPDGVLAALDEGSGREAREVYMSAAQKLIDQGRTEGQAEMLLRQVAARFGAAPPNVVARVRAASGEELAMWAERILTASSLVELFRDD